MKKRTARTIVQLADASQPSNIPLANELANRGWRVHIITHHAPTPGIETAPNVKIHRLPVSPAYPLTYLAFIAAAPVIKSIKPDIIHAHCLTRFGILAAVYRRFLRFRPMVLTACGDDVLIEARRGMTRWSAEHALKMFDAVTCSSDAAAGALSGLGIAEEDIERLDWSEPADLVRTADQLEALYIDLIGRFHA